MFVTALLKTTKKTKNNEKKTKDNNGDDHNDNEMNNDDCGYHKCTVVWNKQEQRRKYWATHSSIRLFARTAHSFTSLIPSLVGK